MIHELKEIIDQAIINQQKGLKNVMASVVHLEGSSYRKPGVRMLISEDLSSVGAVSGGCVEKEIIHRSKSVFKTGKAKIITYDGRYRLGCEGTLYILIEPIFISDKLKSAFDNALKNREQLLLESSYVLEDESTGDFKTSVKFKNEQELFFGSDLNQKVEGSLLIFKQTLKPRFRLLLIGGEHDAVSLCKMASNLGWQIDVITSAKDSQNIVDFPGAYSVSGKTPETVDFENIEDNTAVVIMNHSYVQDLKYVIELSKYNAKYIGILGSTQKRERLLNELFEYVPEVSEDYLDTLYMPAGLHIGSKTPEEIAISIISEIICVQKNKEQLSLRALSGKIHS